MTEELLRCKTEQEIRARFRCAPGYYLQAKLEKRRALARLEQQAGADTQPGGQTDHVEKPIEPATRPEPESLDVTALAPERAEITTLAPQPTKATTSAPKRTKTHLRREVPDFALPGFEILDAALAESDGPDSTPAEPVSPEDPELTQQAILAVALEGYSNWPFLSDAEPEQASQAGSELERKLALVLASEPELELLLDSEPELDLELELEPHPGHVSDNVTVADFGHRAPRTVRVVSVVMDRKRPNMVRVASESTRLAS
jgi:hypothetical protein